MKTRKKSIFGLTTVILTVSILMLGCTQNEKSKTKYISLDDWVGSYQFYEFCQPNISMMFNINIFQLKDDYIAYLSIDGFQASTKIIAKVVGNQEKIYLIYELRFTNSDKVSFEKGDILLSFSKQNDEMLTHWGVVEPALIENKVSGKVYLVKYGLNNNIGCSEALKPKESLGLELAHIPNLGEKADRFYVEQIVGNYERLLIHAINDNDFSLIKNLFIPDSNTYKSQEQFVAEQYSMGIKHNFSRIYLEGIEQVENKNTYIVHATVYFETIIPDKTSTSKEVKRIYTVIDNGEIRKIINIQTLN
ncbi:MAG: DUF5991 domain-containing protein [Firmicutes bacterium]|nr:DUF5991 domain-containing protein [Bacillota bacterium]